MMLSSAPRGQHAARALLRRPDGRALTATCVRAAVIGIGALVVSALNVAPAAARATALGCPHVGLSQPFAPWSDTADYALVTDGGFEGGGAGWTLTGGAGVQEGNETFHVGSSGDHLSLGLPAGSSATSAPQCTGLEHRTIRFFARNGAVPSGSLRVAAVFETRGGTTNVVRLGDIGAGASWSPVDALDTIVNRMAVSQENAISVRWRFTPRGAGDWSIDDVYVDPFRSN